MKVFIGTDLEGVAGVTTFYVQTSPDGPGYPTSCKLLTLEINAAVEGFIEAGADEILVDDGHGPGGIIYELLHPKASYIGGRPKAPMSIQNKYTSDADVTVMIGQHAMAGTPDGNLCHTQNSRTVESYILNGKPIGEIAQWVLYHGAQGVPTIFLSGDRAACREIDELIPGIVTAETKIGLAKNSAICLSKEASRELIREKAKLALQQFIEKPVKPISWPGPYILDKTYFTVEIADQVERNNPKALRIAPRTIRIKGDSIMDVIYA